MITLLKTVTALILLFIAGVGQAQELNGSYKGPIEVQGTPLEFIVNVMPTYDGYTTT